MVKIGGTLGKPAPKLNITVKNTLSVLKGVGAQVGDAKTKSIISGIGGILGGNASPQSAVTNAVTNGATNATTNAPAATQPPLNNLLNNWLKK
jgi:hypothetical protein